MWAFNRPLGRADWAFILGWRQRSECFNGRASSFGLASGPVSPFFKPYQNSSIHIQAQFDLFFSFFFVTYLNILKILVLEVSIIINTRLIKVCFFVNLFCVYAYFIFNVY